MGSLLINVPELSDGELIFNEDETRQILKFFRPGDSTAIDEMEIGNDARRLAQTALIAAIDGSYSMGFIDSLFRAISRPAKGIGQLVKRLARSFSRHEWRHVRRQDLEDVHIYDRVREAVAQGLKQRFKMIQNGIALKRGAHPFYAHIQSANNVVWS